MPKYLVVSPVLHNHVLYTYGVELDLTEDQARPLIEAGAVQEKDSGFRIQDSGEKSEPPAPNPESRLATPEREPAPSPQPPAPSPDPVVHAYEVLEKLFFAGRPYKRGEVIDLTDEQASTIAIKKLRRLD